MTQPATGFTDSRIASGDAFAKLLDFTWRGISFPTSDIKLALRQDLVEHEVLNRDGAHVEATGRAALQVSAQIPFFNTLQRGPNESWPVGGLYPGQWRKVLAAMADRSTGDLQHPELGVITCKPVSFETSWGSATRNGLLCSASWVETTDTAGSLQAIIASLSPMAAALSASADVDEGFESIDPPLPQLPEFEPDFNDFVRSIQAVFDTATLISRRVAGTIDSLLYRCDAVERAIERTTKQVRVTADTVDSAIPTLMATACAAVYAVHKPNDEAVGRVKAWELIEAVQRLRSSLEELKKDAGTKRRRLGIWIPGKGGTLAVLSLDIAASVKAPIDLSDLIRLNPGLLVSAYVPAGTKVRFYLP